MTAEKKLQFHDNHRPAPSKGTITAIMVIYEPPSRLLSRITTIVKQVQSLIIVDNGENWGLKAEIHKHHPEVTWLRNEENGLAKAQNIGLRHAKESGAEWILLCDDDSEADPQMVHTLCDAYSRMPADERAKIAIFAANITEKALKRPSRYIRPKWHGWWFERVGFRQETTLRDIYFACASGSLISMRVIDAIGMMDEGFFVYFIDTEFCLRARSKGYEVAIIRDAVLHHRIGLRSNHQLGGWTFSTTNHPPKSRYYMAYNRTRLWWRYALNQPGYVFFDVIRFMSEIVRIILFEQNQFAKLKAMLYGLAHRDMPQNKKNTAKKSA